MDDARQVGRVAGLWRFPVKSLRGERLREAMIGPDGIEGDRIVHVCRPDGTVVTSRRHPGLLGLAGGIGPDGEATIDGLGWQDARARELVAAAAGPDAGLRPFTAPDRGQRYDVLPLTVITDGMIRALGYDARRFRSNIEISGVAGLAERGWVGHELRIGDAAIGVLKTRQRCVMTTFDPDTGAQDPRVLKRIGREFGARVALDCWVIAPGRVAVGDLVTIAPLRAGVVAPIGNAAEARKRSRAAVGEALTIGTAGG